MSNSLITSLKGKNSRFKSNTVLSPQQLQQCNQFALEMTYGTGHVNAKSFRGTTANRSKKQILANQWAGKVCECAFYNFFTQLSLDLPITEPDFFIGGKGESDKYDFTVNSPSWGNLNISIKSSSHYSNFLLLEAHRYNNDLRYIDVAPGEAPLNLDIFVFCRIQAIQSFDFKKALKTNSISPEEAPVQIQGFLTRKQLLRILSQSNRVLRRGNKDVDPAGLKVANLFFHTSEMHNTWDKIL